MKKYQELTDPLSCLTKAKPDEMLFVLLERDPAAPYAIRRWIAERIRIGKNTPQDQQILEAIQCADAMDKNKSSRGIQIFPMDLNDYAYQCHQDNIRWWQNPETQQPIERNDGQLMMLMVTELSEGFEGLRKNLMDEHLPHRQSIEVELADCLIRIFDYAGARGYDLQGAYEEKRAYNATRPDHRHENRLKEGGKKF